MSIGPILREARRERGLSRHQLGRQHGLSDRMLGYLETDERHIPRDVAPKLAHTLDNPYLYMELACGPADGVMVVPILDGPKVDLNRLSTWMKTAEEIEEVAAAMKRTGFLANARGPEDLTEEDSALLDESLHQEIEAFTALGNDIAQKARTYNRSTRLLWARHLAELEAKGFITRRKSAA